VARRETAHPPILQNMSIEPHEKKPRRPEECMRTAEALLDCLDLPEEVKRVRIRKVTVDIEFEDDDC
jgi:hypothetical protein